MGDLDSSGEYCSRRGYTIRKNNSSATVHLFGATLISWVADGREMLFFSEKAKFTCGEIISGGTPLIFPVFGPWGDAPKHGFARISTWKLLKKRNDSITLILRDNALTRLYWNYRFLFVYTLVLIDNRHMKIEITITNLGEDPFPFSFLLHNYFSVSDISKCRLSGLKRCKYIDKIKDGREHMEDKEDIEVSKFTDRLYYNTRVIHRIKNVTSTRDIVMEKMNLPDTVLWSPWETTKDMPDFDDDEWKIMVCVASGCYNPPVVLEPNESYIACQILGVERSSSSLSRTCDLKSRKRL